MSLPPHTVQPIPAVPAFLPPSVHPGKSTVLRALASLALLSSAGLKVPAAEATLPRFSHIILRNFRWAGSVLAVRMCPVQKMPCPFVTIGPHPGLRNARNGTNMWLLGPVLC